MRPCTVCGNDIPDRASTCPFCEQPQEPMPAPRRRARSDDVPVINVKEGMPVVSAALRRLEAELQGCRTRGHRVVRVVHGWGSSGQGGSIGRAVRRHLAALRGRGLVSAFVAGEDYSETSAAGRGMLERHAALRRSLPADRLNRGITLVEL